MNIPLSSPDITELEIKYVTDVLKTPYLSLGPKLNEFEEKFAEYIGAKHAIAVNSGTSGLHLCIKALGISEGDEVITTSFSFIASASCLLYERAKPIFVDIDKSTLNICPDKIEEFIEKSISQNRQHKIKAILPVHVFGHPCDMQKIMGIANRYNLLVIEDACEALGAEYGFRETQGNGMRYTIPEFVNKKTALNSTLSNHTRETIKWKKAGTIGKVGVFAFYPNKQMTTGEGGIIVTNDKRISDTCKSLRNQGRSSNSRWLKHVRLGYNYRISDINCALGLAQLQRLEEILQKRERIANLYNQILKNCKGFRIPYVDPSVRMSWFVYVLHLDEEFGEKERDSIINALKRKGIACSNYFPPIHLQPIFVNLFGYRNGALPITEKIAERTLALPFHNNLTEQEVWFIAETLKGEINRRI
ncbi:DegT/DnrJ/EryC1/StrS family aminotransferase [candidate division KSB1 bacterium]|nr:DegT/DnrJ/EryC1/StrS family aminotransferase [candidate division KSB1 bacterium]